MMTIANTPQYQISVAPDKNRAYLRIIGFWRNAEQVPDYISDWKKAVAALSPGFTLLTDAREMKIHPASVRALHEEAQALVVQKGVRKVAELQQDAVAEMQLDAVAQETRMPKKNFQTQKEAEFWLDS
jgi:hypothetical protein